MELTFNGQIEPGYIKEVKDILENREFMQLGAFSHHQSTSRLMHSINVSYISWHIARKLGCEMCIRDSLYGVWYRAYPGLRG